MRELYALARWRETTAAMHRAQQQLRSAAERWQRACRLGLYPYPYPYPYP